MFLSLYGFTGKQKQSLSVFTLIINISSDEDIDCWNGVVYHNGRKLTAGLGKQCRSSLHCLLHCLPSRLQLLDALMYGKTILLKFYDYYSNFWESEFFEFLMYKGCAESS